MCVSIRRKSDYRDRWFNLFPISNGLLPVRVYIQVHKVMTKEIGSREKALREMREVRFARSLLDVAPLPKATKTSLKKAITEAAKKRGRPRKAKK